MSCVSLSVFSAEWNEEMLSEYLTVSTVCVCVCVCVHPLLCVIVKKQCRLLWNREKVFSINHMVDLFTEARCFGPKRAIFSCKRIQDKSLYHLI